MVVVRDDGNPKLVVFVVCWQDQFTKHSNTILVLCFVFWMRQTDAEGTGTNRRSKVDGVVIPVTAG